MTRPAITITITADDGAELECHVWAEPPDRAVGILTTQFEIEPLEPGRSLSATEERRAWKAAREWHP